MATATIKLVSDNFLGEFYFRKNQAATARRLLEDGCYRVGGKIVVPFSGEAAAEEVFDLTNNPARQDEREQVYGLGRSISVGDILDVEGQEWLCCSHGWCRL